MAFENHCSRLILYLISFSDINFNPIPNFEVWTIYRFSNIEVQLFKILYWDIFLIDYNLHFYFFHYYSFNIPAIYVKIPT